MNNKVTLAARPCRAGCRWSRERLDLHQASGSEVLDCIDIELLPALCIEPVNKDALHAVVVANHNGFLGDTVDGQCIGSLVNAIQSILHAKRQWDRQFDSSVPGYSLGHRICNACPCNVQKTYKGEGQKSVQI